MANINFFSFVPAIAKERWQKLSSVMETFLDEVRVKGEWKCFICAEDFLTEDSLQSHLESEHQIEAESHLLDDSDNILVKQEAADQDFELEPTVTSESRAPNSCGTCGESFSNSSNLNRHQKRFHSKPEVDLCFPDCPRAFKSPASLHRHKVV